MREPFAAHRLVARYAGSAKTQPLCQGTCSTLRWGKTTSGRSCSRSACEFSGKHVVRADPSRTGGNCANPGAIFWARALKLAHVCGAAIPNRAASPWTHITRDQAESHAARKKMPLAEIKVGSARTKIKNRRLITEKSSIADLCCLGYLRFNSFLFVIGRVDPAWALSFRYNEMSTESRRWQAGRRHGRG